MIGRPSFIPDIVAAAKSNETLCENCMVILKVSPQVCICNPCFMRSFVLSVSPYYSYSGFI